MKETGEENRTRESINEKPPELDEEMWEENRKIIDIVNEKTFQPRQGQGRKNRKWCGERKDLVGNKVLFSSQRGRTANSSIHQIQAPRRSLRQGVRSPATCQLLASLKTKLTRIPFLLSYPHLMRFVACSFASRPRFCLRSSLGLAVGLAIKWLAALPSSAGGPSCRKSSYRRSSHRRSSHCGSEPSELEPSGASHRRCNVNKRYENCFGGKKNNRLMIGKKPPNPAGTEEKNRGRKVFLVVQSFRINFLSR